MRDQYQCHGITASGKRCQRRCDNKGFCGVHPTAGGFVTKTGFAKMQGVDKSMVSKWLKEATITETPQGYVEWEKAQQAIAESRDPSRALQRQGTPHPESLVAQSASDGEQEEDLGDAWDKRYVRARALKEEETHKLAKLKRLEEEGKLVDAEQVALDFANVAAIVQQKMRTIPVRIAAQVLACTTEAEARSLLSREIDIALSSLADGFTGDDDED
jgi:phage terminase Nu1 subunit (DNA packaging protein)